MVRHFNLLAGLTIALALVSGAGASAAGAKGADPCNAVNFRLGNCASTDGTAVNLRAKKATPHPGSPERPGAPSSPGRKLTPKEVQAAWDDLCFGEGTCLDRGPNTLNSWIRPPDPVPATPAVPDRVVTIADVARFLPAVAGLHAEPDGWAVVGVPANFWVEVAPITVDGELLDEAAQVRFTPQAYRWSYGDGGHRTTVTPGAAWEALGQEELTATPTGHVYEERATVDASVAVIYSAEYRVADGGWTAVTGAVTGEAPPLPMLVVNERTALVADAG